MSHSRAGAGDFVSPFLDIEMQLYLMKQKLACISTPTRNKFPIKEDHMEWDEVTFSWITEDGIELPPADQGEGDDCWSWAFYRGHRYYTAINGIHGFKRLNYNTFRNGVPRRHLNFDGGIDNIESVKSYLIDNNHISDMIVYRRQLENYQDPDFEILIEKLLIEGPVVATFDSFPSYLSSYSGTGVYIPNVVECQTTAYEIYQRHTVVITGFGEIMVHGKLRKFWEIQDSKGGDWGRLGFDYLARGMGLIREAVEFKF